MSKIARNTLKGYSYQQRVLSLFVAMMDSKREIISLSAEIDVNHNFDDMSIQMNDNSFFVQVKNYPNTYLSDIAIKNSKIKIKTNYSNFDANLNNIIIINTDKIQPDGSEIFGLPAIKVEDIYVIPLTLEDIDNAIESLLSNEARIIKIVSFSYERCINFQGSIYVADLPEFSRFGTDLEEKTILLREPLKTIDKGITWIVGKPGVGKSHYVKELQETYPKAVIYRFWIGSQDKHQQTRLIFNNFLTDIAMEAFKSPKRFEIEDLVSAIEAMPNPIVFDGLDHIENYNPNELELFINFFDMLNNACVVILSRPLQRPLSWNKIELENWSKDDTHKYLNFAHLIKEYSVASKIYDISNGYPIITNFLAEHYKLHGELNLTDGIKSIEEYYDNLLKQVAIRNAINIFLLNNSFFQREEITELCDTSALSDIIFEFIEAYPYLFKCCANRLSLIHDSLNTYLRSKSDLTAWNNAIEKIKLSIRNKELRYLSRFSSFNFEKDFVSEILQDYANLIVYEQLMKTNFDYASIQEFYQDMQVVLEDYPDSLDVYQYYEFVLIYSIINRNDMIGYDDLIFQILLYAKNNYIDEKSIFSSGYFWCLYLMQNYNDRFSAFRFFAERHYGSYAIDFTDRAFAKEKGFFEVLENDFDEKVVWSEFKRAESSVERRDIFFDYLVNIWVNKLTNTKWYPVVQRYLDNEDDYAAYNEMLSFCLRNGIDEFYANVILSDVRYRLWELGIVKQENILFENEIADLIRKNAKEGSFELHKILVSYLRLANRENREVDINAISLFWGMHYNRKDYSVSSLDNILTVLEKKGLICEKDAFELIIRARNQSEDGIQHLLCDYINSKDANVIIRLAKMGKPIDTLPVNMFDLNPEHLDLLSESKIIIHAKQLLGYGRYRKTVDYNKFANVIKSKHADIIFDLFQKTEYQVQNVPESEAALFGNISITIAENEEQDDYVPFKDGYIHEADLDYIKDEKISHLKVASYVNVWYSCFPLILAYEHYEKNDLRNDALKIIHTALFAKAPRLNEAGYWRRCPGSILEFLDLIEFDANWEQLFDSVRTFLRLSFISD